MITNKLSYSEDLDETVEAVNYTGVLDSANESVLNANLIVSAITGTVNVMPEYSFDGGVTWNEIGEDYAFDERTTTGHQWLEFSQFTAELWRFKITLSGGTTTATVVISAIAKKA